MTKSLFFLFKKCSGMQWDMLTSLYPTGLQFWSLQGAGSGRWAIFHWLWFFFSGGRKKSLSTHLQFFPEPAVGAIETQECSYHLPTPSVVHKPRFPRKSHTLIKRKEGNTNQKEKNQEERLGHSHTHKKLIKQGQRGFYMVWKISRAVHCWCLCFFVPDMFLYSKTNVLWCQMDKSIQSLLMFLDFLFK